MSMAEKHRHDTRKGESKVRSQFHKYALQKKAAVVNHVEYERHHGFESSKRGDSVPPVEPAS